MVCRAQEVISHPERARLCLLGTLQVCALLAIEALCCGLVPGPRGQGLVLGMLRLGGSVGGSPGCPGLCGDVVLQVAQHHCLFSGICDPLQPSSSPH